MNMTDRLIGLALSTGVVVPTMMSPDHTMPIIGVGIAAVAGALVGTGVAIAYDQERRPTGRMLGLAVATFFAAIMIVGFIPEMMGWEWQNDGTEFGLTGASAWIGYYVLPPAGKRVGELIRSFKWSDIPILRKRNTDFTQYDQPTDDDYPAEEPHRAVSPKEKKR